MQTPQHSAPASFSDLFVDIDENTLLKNANPDDIKDIQAELLQHSALEHGNLKVRSGFSIKPILILLIIGALAALGYQFAQPALDYYNGKKQVTEAMTAISNGQEQVKNYIRQHSIFPDPKALSFNNSNTYTLQIDPTGQKDALVLTFTNNAATPLRGHTLTSQFVTKENYTTWKCKPDSAFPQDYSPKNCF